MKPTSQQQDDTTDDDSVLLRAAQEYLAEMESGRRPLRAEFAARFPHLGPELTPYLDAIDMIHAPPRGSVGVRPVAAEALFAEPLGDFRIVREIGRGSAALRHRDSERRFIHYEVV